MNSSINENNHSLNWSNPVIQSIKKAKVSDDSSNPPPKFNFWILSSSTYKEFSEIASFLAPQELGRMECVNTHFYDKVHQFWPSFALQNHAFEWIGVRDQKSPAKWNAVLKMALIDVVSQFAKASDNEVEIGVQLWSKYQQLIDHFPTFKFFISNKLSPFLGDSLLKGMVNHKKMIMRDVEEGQEGCETLLKALINPPTKPIKLKQLSLKIDAAMVNGVTCASFLLRLEHPNLWSPADFEEKAILANQLGDHQPLNELIQTYSLGKLQSLNAKYPDRKPITNRIARLESPSYQEELAKQKLLEAESLKEKMMEDESDRELNEDDHSVVEEPVMVRDLEQDPEELMVEAIMKYGDNIPFHLLIQIANLQFNFHQNEIAKELYLKAMSNMNEIALCDPKLLTQTANNLIALELAECAFKFIDKTLPNLLRPLSKEIIYAVALSKYCLGESQWVANFLKSEIRSFNARVPLKIMVAAFLVFFESKEFVLADKIYNHLVKNPEWEGGNSIEFLSRASKLKNSLGHFDEANALSERIYK